MKAGALDQRIVIERLVEGFDELGQPINTWLPIITTWAHVQPLVGREYIAAGALLSEVTARISLRYRPGITAADRVIHDGKVYGVTSVGDVHSSRRELQLQCRAIG
ncbi:phage head closure protein [Acidovorax carolinensis]|uniref:phage head closure protein n=1 Tax=Acidovorax carolinensis TaxID=553814 RepID=UPI000B346A95|nr:phage head closure protein [Acidovorax carolinensis]ART49202.1 head-tail adaptor protein [Acidovorax carolinensis]